jgi:hypothetical protein
LPVLRLLETVEKIEMIEDDGIEGFNDHTEGDDPVAEGSGVLQGIRCKFTNDAEWTTAAGDPMRAEISESTETKERARRRESTVERERAVELR